jgi:hypothetical protein
LAGLPFLAALAFYYLLINGSVVPDIARVAPTVQFGLYPVDEAGNHLSFLHELQMATRRLVALAEWSSPLLVLGAFAAYIPLIRQHRLSFVDLIFPTFVIAYLLVPFSGDNQYGPRYYFEGFPTLVLTLVSALVPLLKDTAKPQRVAGTWFLLLAHGGLSLVALGFICYWFHTEIDQRMNLYDQVASRNLHNAVVVVHSSTGKVAQMEPRDLVRNGIEIGADVIYALDRPGDLGELRRLFPQRQFFIYERDERSPTGMLRPLTVIPAETPPG